MAVKNGLIRFATKGFRAQRLNPDGTIPRPGRAVGFHGTVDLRGHTSNGMAKLTIKVGSHEAQTRQLNFANVGDLANVTVAEVCDAINSAGFTHTDAKQDPATGRLLLRAANVEPARLYMEARRTGELTAMQVPVPLMRISLRPEGYIFSTPGPVSIEFEAGASTSALIELVEQSGQLVSNFPRLLGSWVGSPDAQTPWPAPSPIAGFLYRDFTPAIAPPGTNGIIQVVGPLASALDFGQGRRHGGDLRCLSFFNDTAMSITLPKDIIEREEIDVEGANGSPTRMVIGARMQGKTPVITMKEKNYDFLQLVQGGRLNRATGEYDPPMPNESEHPMFLIEIYGPVYGQGANRQDDMKGYERILLRNCMGWEGDVPIEAKAWAQYAYNVTAIEYSDENGSRFPAWQEQQLSIAQFEDLRVNDISMTEDELGNNVGISENLSAAESRGASAAVASAAVQPAREGVLSREGTGLEGLPGDWSDDD